MPIENIDCPQFVDFTSGEAFMMDDGADFCFDKRVVGSEDVVDLGFFNQPCRPIPTTAENRTIVFKETNNGQSEKKSVEMTNEPMKAVNEPLLLTPKKPAALEKENKENISGVGVNKVGSALDLINAKQSALMSTGSSNSQPQVFSEHNRPPSAQCAQANKSRIRTLSSANAVPPKPTTDKPNNVLPIGGYKGIRFLPKQPISSVLSTPSKDKKQAEVRKNSNTTVTNISTSESMSKALHQPRIIGGLFDSTNNKPDETINKPPSANLLRATSVKSYSSNKHTTATPSTTTSTVTSKPPNLIATLKSNLMRVSRTQAKPPTAPSSSMSSHDLSSMMSKKLNMNESGNTSRLNGSIMQHQRKKSESKSGGLLHTEMRAMKRSEYDQAMREKEKMAQHMRAQIEAQKAQQEHEELTRMRSQSVVKAQPAKHYKPIDIKPSDQPLTAPRSPNFIATNTSRLARSNSRSNITTSASSLPNNHSHLSQNNYV